MVSDRDERVMARNGVDAFMKKMGGGDSAGIWRTSDGPIFLNDIQRTVKLKAQCESQRFLSNPNPKR